MSSDFLFDLFVFIVSVNLCWVDTIIAHIVKAILGGATSHVLFSSPESDLSTVVSCRALV